MTDYRNAKSEVVDTLVWWSTLPYYSISLSLNILLTLMIIARLVLHARDTRIALGMTGIGGLCTAIVIMLAGSCVLYAVSSLLVIGLFVARSGASEIFIPILSETQVCAFPRLHRSGRLINGMIGRIGHCSAPHHSMDRQQDCADEQYCGLSTSRSARK